jgi:membrane protease YdiL (CAAX protease family)
MLPDEPHDIPQEPDQPAETPALFRGNTNHSVETSESIHSQHDLRRPNQDLLPEDLRVPWGWLDLLLFALVAVIGALAINVILVLIYAEFGGHLTRSYADDPATGLIAASAQTILFIALLGYLAFNIYVRAGTPFWRTIGWRPFETLRVPTPITCLGFVAGGLALSFLVQLLSSAFPPKTNLPMEALFQDRRTAALIMFISITLAPLVEETIFRGYIYPVVARSFGITTSAIATGTVFGLLHAQQLWGGWIQIAALVVVGIIFTFARAISRTVIASYLLHVSYNSFIFVAFLIASHGLRVMPTGY